MSEAVSMSDEEVRWRVSIRRRYLEAAQKMREELEAAGVIVIDGVHGTGFMRVEVIRSE